MNTQLLKISDLETILQKGLEALENSQLDPDSSEAATYLLPDGYRPVITLTHGDGRKIRSNAAAWNFTPSADHIVIGFEKLPDPPTAAISTVSPTPARPSPPQAIPIVSVVAPPIAGVGVTALDVQQCCDALAEAERSSLEFIGLKRFLLYFLPAKGFVWTKSAELCRKVLTAAIGSGEIETYKVPNPNNPGFPTTAIRLKHLAIPPEAMNRFNPIPARQ